MTAAMTASVERTSVVEPHLRILHTVAQAVSGSLDVDEVLRTALDALTHVTGHEMSSLLRPRALGPRLGSWAGIGRVAVGMTRQGWVRRPKLQE